MEAERYYHIFNRTINKELLFKETENYSFFLKQLNKYVVPVADVFAYCLIPNHFHLVLRIKNDKELKDYFTEKFAKKNPSERSKPYEGLVSLQFGHLFNSYTQAFNKKYNRKGSLFNPRFKRKPISTEAYLRQVIVYVHLNPISHEVSSDYKNYPHSSYGGIVSTKPTLLKRNEVIKLFDDLENFQYVHQSKQINEDMLKEIFNEDD